MTRLTLTLLPALLVGGFTAAASGPLLPNAWKTFAVPGSLGHQALLEQVQESGLAAVLSESEIPALGAASTAQPRAALDELLLQHRLLRGLGVGQSLLPAALAIYLSLDGDMHLAHAKPLPEPAVPNAIQ